MDHSAMEKFYNRLLDIDSYVGSEDFKVRLLVVSNKLSFSSSIFFDNSLI
jgi:hypothetical protein